MVWYWAVLDIQPLSKSMAFLDIQVFCGLVLGIQDHARYWTSRNSTVEIKSYPSWTATSQRAFDLTLLATSPTKHQTNGDLTGQAKACKPAYRQLSSSSTRALSSATSAGCRDQQEQRDVSAVGHSHSVQPLLTQSLSKQSKRSPRSVSSPLTLTLFRETTLPV